MKGSDEEEYGSFYSGHGSSRSSGARYRYRDYSPSRSHGHQASQGQGPSSTTSSASTLVDSSPYAIPPPGMSFTRTAQYGPSGGGGSRGMVEYAPPCCHPFYHPPPPPIPLHPSPSHFNTIPHPPLQYRDAPSCSTLNRSCYNRRQSNNPYTTYYSNNSESPYADPRSDIYYTSTLARHPRSSNSHRYSSGGSSSGHDHHSTHSDSGSSGSKHLYDPPPPPMGYGSTSTAHRGHHSSHQHHMGSGNHGGCPPSASSMRSYMSGPPGLRLDEPRIYSSSALQLGTASGGTAHPPLPRSNSPQNHHHHFIDRSISLIRLDNSGSGLVLPPGSSPLSTTHESNNSVSSGQSRIKFTSDLQSVPQASGGQASGTSSLLKTTIELGSSSDPLQQLSQATPAKSKFKIVMDSSTLLPSKPPSRVVEMFDKGVMTSQLPEQWSLMSSGSGESRRVSAGAVSPPGNSPPPALSGGIPDLLPTCVVRHGAEYTSNPWRSSGGSNMAPSPRRFHGTGMAGPSTSSGLGGSRATHKSGGSSGGGSSHHHSHPHTHHHVLSPPRTSRWAAVRKYVRAETKTFFGLVDGAEDLKEEWLSRRKRFASRRYSERNVDSMPPPSPYQPMMAMNHGPGFGGHDLPDARLPVLDHRPPQLIPRTRRTRKKDCVFVIYWNLLRWLFWSIRFGRTGQRVAAGAGCGSDTNPGSGSTPPGRVPLDGQMSRDRTKSRSLTPTTLVDIPPNVTVSPTELFFDDLEDNHRNSTHHLQPPGRGLHWRIGRPQPTPSGLLLSNRISSQILSKVLDNSERQQYRQSLRQLTSNTSKSAQIDEYEDFRPYFTYWVSIVQIIILIVSMITYGLAPVGPDLHRKSALVLVTSLSLQQMEIVQPANFWIGPSAGDLIHLGAKYAPCMRRDEKIYRRIIETRDQERQTACCIRNDNSGCVQSSRNECSIKGVSRTGLLSTWKKWTGKEVPGGRISGSVCGLDPKFCEAPASIAPYEWPDDITKWPICRKTRGLSGMSTKDKTAEHMVCEVIGHPCCIGIHARCVITTREYCRFVSGYFHEEASLCSQVSCLQDVCGMFPFLAYESPDQFYRLISSLFLHAGLGHICVTLLFHWFIMRDLEKLAGPLRIAIIYIGSGIAGNLASVLLEPHRAEVGPGGGQYGLMACLLVELLHMWSMLRRPWQALGKMVLVTGALFLIGFLPWVDNFAHLVGFAAGFLLSHALMPYIAFGKYSSYRKWLEVVISLGVFLGVLVALLVVFYAGFGDCEFCQLLNCLPLTQDFCAEQEIDLKPSGGGINLIT